MGAKQTEDVRKNACKKFLSFFPSGFADPKYISWERGYKWNVHLLWQKLLNKKQFTHLLENKKYKEIAETALSIEGKTHLLFSFEKMAIRDALKTRSASKQFSEGLYNLIYGHGKKSERFNNFVETLALLPRKQSRVLTWPLVTVFGFIADPKHFIYLKPMVTKVAAEKYDYDFDYVSRPTWHTYQSLMNFAKLLKSDLEALKPRDYIDIQSFIWTLGSEEYA
ncbi:hypothetical protein ACNVED_06765 [Legionella sp. D16C41]|uniref:hypothetical protein n=1 Tax=Legionella sp. D16C41 TaxID=3402688 RepID=UPI003AF5D1CB